MGGHVAMYTRQEPVILSLLDIFGIDSNAGAGMFSLFHLSSWFRGVNLPQTEITTAGILGCSHAEYFVFQTCNLLGDVVSTNGSNFVLYCSGGRITDSRQLHG
jgi:hypothetical protein